MFETNYVPQRFNIPAITEALLTVKEDIAGLRKDPERHAHDFRNGIVIDRFVQGFSYVDYLITQDKNPLKDHYHIYELDKIIVYGNDFQEWMRHFEVIESVRAQFSSRIAKIGQYAQNKNPFMRAAQAFSYTCSKPLPFLDGNMRTALLLANYVLAKADLPPFVPQKENARNYFDQTADFEHMHKRNPILRVRMHLQECVLAFMFEKSSSSAYLK
ncbi:MAG: Fic family protein [archaeon]